MKNITTWEQLEDFVKEILCFDNSIKPKGSGSSKKEEDIMSDNIIVQCKFTDNKNISILDKDMKRLEEAYKLLEKFPLFINKSKDMTTLSVPINSDLLDTTDKIISIIVISQCIKNLMNWRQMINDHSTLAKYEKTFNRMRKRFWELRELIKADIETIESFIDAKHVSLNTYDLFDGEDNGH